MQDQLQKAIKLAKKTGDRLIVFDQNNTNLTYVIMTLDDYERMLDSNSEVKGLTEDELLDKINRNIALWKSEQDFDSNIDFGWVKEALKDRSAQWGDDEENEDDYDDYEEECGCGADHFAPTESMTAAKNENKPEGHKSKWIIPPTRKNKAEEILDEDENTSYLEEITF